MVQKFVSWPMVLLICVIGLIGFNWMPKEYYKGDSYMVKLSAINLATTSQFGIQADLLEGLGFSAVLKTGQYFHKNEDQHRYYSRWGFFNTALFAIPELFVTHPADKPLDYSPESVFAHNIFNLLLAILSGALLYLIVTEFSQRNVTRLIFVLTTLYSTFIFNYLRTQSYEIFQLVFFLFFFLQFIRFAKERTFSRAVRWSLPLWALILTKDFFFVLYVPVFIFVALEKPKKGLWVIGSFLVPLTIILIANGFQFEDALFLKKASLFMSDTNSEPFSFSHLPGRVNDYFLTPRANLFFYFPALLFALLGAKSFFHNHKAVYIFLVGIFLAVLVPLLFFFSIGEWCYGPRFLIVVLPLLSLPMLSFLDEVLSNLKSHLNKLLLGSFILVMGYSTVLQFELNQRPFFLKYQLSNFFSTFEKPNSAAYFLEVPASIIAQDFNHFVNEGKGFYPLIESVDGLDTESQVQVIRRLKAYCETRCQCNYHFAWNCPAP